MPVSQTNPADNARNHVARREAPANMEQEIRVTGGARRTDVVVARKGGKLGIEVKVGRTSLTKEVRQELARDWKGMRSGERNAIRWEFFRSARTGQCGPTGPLRAMLDKLGFEIMENPGISF